MPIFQANYARVSPFFEVANLPQREGQIADTPLDTLTHFWVAFFQKQSPAPLSSFLAEKLGQAAFPTDTFELLAAEGTALVWNRLQDGSAAKELYYQHLPQYLGFFAYLHPLWQPDFKWDSAENLKIDFYLAPFKTAILIDKTDILIDEKLKNEGVQVFFFSSQEILQNSASLKAKMAALHHHLSKNQFKERLQAYQRGASVFLSQALMRQFWFPTALARLERLFLALLERKALRWDTEWKLAFFSVESEIKPILVEWAFQNLMLKFQHLSAIINPNYRATPPRLTLHWSEDREELRRFKARHQDFFAIDFSIRLHQTDEHLAAPELIWVRNTFDNQGLRAEKHAYEPTFAPPQNKTSNQSSWAYFYAEWFSQMPPSAQRQWHIAQTLNQVQGANAFFFPERSERLLPLLLVQKMAALWTKQTTCLFFPTESLMRFWVRRFEKLNLKNYLVLHKKFDFAPFQDNPALFLAHDFILLTPAAWDNAIKNEFWSKIIKKANENHQLFWVFEQAHLLLEWHQEFSLPYLQALRRIKALTQADKWRAQFLSSAATKVLQKELCRLAEISPEARFTAWHYQRNDLKINVLEVGENKYLPLTVLLRQKLAAGQRGIVITPQINGSTGCVLLAERLKFDLKTDVFYWAEQLPTEPIQDERVFLAYQQEVEQRFFEGRIDLLTTTAALALGIDLPALDFIIFYGASLTFDTFFQTIVASRESEIFVLFTPEKPENEEVMKKLFLPQTPLDALKNQSREISWFGQDAYKALHQWASERDSLSEDAAFALHLYSRFEKDFKQNLPFTLSIKELDFRFFVRATDRFLKVEQILELFIKLQIIEAWHYKSEDAFYIFPKEHQDLTLEKAFEQWLQSTFLPERIERETVSTYFQREKHKTKIETYLKYGLYLQYLSVGAFQRKAYEKQYEFCLAQSRKEVFAQELQAEFEAHSSTHLFLEWATLPWENEDFAKNGEVQNQIKEDIVQFFKFIEQENLPASFWLEKIRAFLATFEKVALLRLLEGIWEIWVEEAKKGAEKVKENLFFIQKHSYLKELFLAQLLIWIQEMPQERRAFVAEAWASHFPDDLAQTFEQWQDVYSLHFLLEKEADKLEGLTQRLLGGAFLDPN
ncbi:helicase-related protein [Hugenholtzia roseola]|uniref:helicase-related protein n=1 Tax=Hugenholtzia roseola TaxID=1002 RepID=UPI000406C0D1|nr:helicase-related protein [Hugenholtzia roseola]